MGLIGTIKGAVAGLLTELAGEKGWLNEKLNSFAINKLASAGRTRPHPWSTLNDYVSWRGLTDRSYNARLLPAAPAGQSHPDSEATVALFKTTGPQRACPKSTCLFAAFAQYLTDGFIRTQLSNDPAKEDRKRTTTNHEIDLSPLYGRTHAQTLLLRQNSNEPGQKGRLKSQSHEGEEYSPFLYVGRAGNPNPLFFDSDGNCLLDLPLGIDSPYTDKKTLFAAGGDRVNASPQTAMINILLLREHNRLAGVISAANPTWDDDRVFETVRNVMIVMFIKIVVEEYINHINTEKFKLRALPDAAWSADWNRSNFITTEFSLLYRWHSLIPREMLWGITPRGPDVLTLNNDVLFKRGLAASFFDVSSNAAAELGLFNSAEFLIKAEKKAIEQARLNRLPTYNAYRAAMGLDPAASWDDITGKIDKAKTPAERDRRVRGQQLLKELYGTPDKVEFYTGLFAEPRQPNGPLPELLLKMVAMDAFSQAFTNPLLSKHIWGNKDVRRATFTDQGLAVIEATGTLKDMLLRNSTGLDGRFVGMTRPGWVRE